MPPEAVIALGADYHEKMEKKLAAKILLGLLTAGSLWVPGGTAEADEAEDLISVEKLGTYCNEYSSGLTVTLEGEVVDGHDNYNFSFKYKPNPSAPLTIHQDPDKRRIVVGGYSKGENVSNNEVFMKYKNNIDQIYGGYSRNGNANGNSVIIESGNIWGSNAMGDVQGGFSMYAEASGNSVTLKNGTVGDSNSLNRVAISGGNGKTIIEGNTVTISGGAVYGAVVGGYGRDTTNGVKPQCINNTIILENTPDLTKATLKGWAATWDSSNTTELDHSGNTLELRNTDGIQVSGVEHFDKLVLNNFGLTSEALTLSEGANGKINLGSVTEIDWENLYVSGLTEERDSAVVLTSADGFNNALTLNSGKRYKKDEKGNYNVTLKGVDGKSTLTYNTKILDTLTVNDNQLVYKQGGTKTAGSVYIGQAVDMNSDTPVIKLGGGSYDFDGAKYQAGSYLTNSNFDVSLINNNGNNNGKLFHEKTIIDGTGAKVYNGDTAKNGLLADKSVAYAYDVTTGVKATGKASLLARGTEGNYKLVLSADNPTEISFGTGTDISGTATTPLIEGNNVDLSGTKISVDKEALSGIGTVMKDEFYPTLYLLSNGTNVDKEKFSAPLDYSYTTAGNVAEVKGTGTLVTNAENTAVNMHLGVNSIAFNNLIWNAKALNMNGADLSNTDISVKLSGFAGTDTSDGLLTGVSLLKNGTGINSEKLSIENPAYSYETTGGATISGKGALVASNDNTAVDMQLEVDKITFDKLVWKYDNTPALTVGDAVSSINSGVTLDVTNVEIIPPSENTLIGNGYKMTLIGSWDGLNIAKLNIVNGEKDTNDSKGYIYNVIGGVYSYALQNDGATTRVNGRVKNIRQNTSDPSSEDPKYDIIDYTLGAITDITVTGTVDMSNSAPLIYCDTNSPNELNDTMIDVSEITLENGGANTSRVLIKGASKTWHAFKEKAKPKSVDYQLDNTAGSLKGTIEGKLSQDGTNIVLSYGHTVNNISVKMDIFNTETQALELASDRIYDFTDAKWEAENTPTVSSDKLLGKDTEVTLINGEAAEEVTNLTFLNKKTAYNYQLADGGVTVTGENSTKADEKKVLGVVDSVNLRYGEVAPTTDGVVLSGNEAELSGSDIDLTKLSFKALAEDTHEVKLLTAVTGLNEANISGAADSVDCKYTGIGVELEGTRSMGITNTDMDITASLGDKVAVSAVTVDTISKDTLLTLDKTLSYDFSKVDEIGGRQEVSLDRVLADGERLTIVKGNGVAMTSAAASYEAKDYSYSPVTGVTVAGRAQFVVENGNLNYMSRGIDSITFGQGLEWKTGGTVLALEAGRTYNLAGTTVDTMNLGFTADSLKTLTAGDNTMTLLDTKGNTTLAASNLKAKQVEYAVGTALKGTGTASLAANGNVMYAINMKDTTPDLTETDQPHAAAMAASAGIAAVSSAASASVDTAMGALKTAPAGETTGFAGFGAGTSKYKTGSDVQSTMWQGTFGAGTKKELKEGASFAWGVFFECGRGSYTTHNEHAKYTRGDGKMNYLGGGLTARYTTPSKLYTEMAVHAGRLTNDADRVLSDINGNTYGYKSKTNYYGFSLGLGKTFELSDKKSYDVYGTFYYNRNGSDSFNAGSDRYDLDAVNSELLRLGVRYNQRVSDSARLYAGLAFDYEFDGKSTGTVTNGGTRTAIRSSDIKGASGMLELGMELKSPDSPWELDLGAKAYAGKHQGFSGNIGIKYLF